MRKFENHCLIVKRTTPHSTMQEQGDEYGTLPVLRVFHIRTVFENIILKKIL